MSVNPVFTGTPIDLIEIACVILLENREYCSLSLFKVLLS